MCGIYGQISDSAAPRECGLSIRHRGPDDAGAEVFPVPGTNLSVTLVHRRLSIIDLSPAGHQPMANEDGTIWITFNGEIYNFQELRAQLIHAGHRFQSKTDTETIIHGYEQWGDEIIPRLRGMFALAIWDATKRRLLLSRDRVGKKPLYYYAENGKFFFGSEIKALLANGEIQVQSDPLAIHDYLTYLYMPAPRTAFRNIHKLLPASTLTVEVGRDGALTHRLSTFWDAAEVAGGTRLLSHKQAIERVRELLDESVRIRLMSDVPLGVFLSGGLDSGAITALAAKNSSQPVKTFSIGFRNSAAFDESEQANDVARKFGTDHCNLQVDAQCSIHIPTVVRHFDEPFGNPTAILEYILTKHMREHVTVALSGDGGDEAFGGYVRYVGASWAEKYRCLPTFLTRGLISRMSGALKDDTSGRHGHRRIREFLESAWMPQQEMYLRWVGYFNEEEKHELYTPDFAHQVGSHDSGNFLRELFRRSAALEPLNRLGYVDLASFLAGNCLEYADRMSMANSLEVRCPFTDHHILEFGLAIPFAWKYQPGKTKWIVREAMKGILPESVLRKKKTGFNPPMPEWIGGELRPLIAQMLSRENIEQRGMFRFEAVNRLLQDHFEYRRDNALKIWALLMLEVWQQMYIDGEAGAPVQSLIAASVEATNT
jgi:asparagine synthase (glutamine-hydrolysing)